MDGISIIICCYNSARLLPETIRNLACQHVGMGISWEIILVNNNSSDNTVEVAQKEWSKYQVPNTDLVIINEMEPGLSNARKKGVNTAKYDIVIFCDDDNWLDKDFIHIAYGKMKSNVKVGVLGGKSFIASDTNLPDWWEDYKHGYAVGEQALLSGVLTDELFIWGAGMVSRKVILLRVFDNRYPSILSDRKGSELSSGGDVEICKRVRLLGFDLYYEESLILIHNITPERLSIAYRDKMFQGHIEGVKLLKYYDQVISISNLNFGAKILNLCKEILKIATKPFRKTQSNQDSLNRLATILMLPGISNNPAYKMILKFKRNIIV